MKYYDWVVAGDDVFLLLKDEMALNSGLCVFSSSIEYECESFMHCLILTSYQRNNVNNSDNRCFQREHLQFISNRRFHGHINMKMNVEVIIEMYCNCEVTAYHFMSAKTSHTNNEWPLEGHRASAALSQRW